MPLAALSSAVQLAPGKDHPTPGITLTSTLRLWHGAAPVRVSIAVGQEEVRGVSAPGQLRSALGSAVRWAAEEQSPVAHRGRRLIPGFPLLVS